MFWQNEQMEKCFYIGLCRVDGFAFWGKSCPHFISERGSDIFSVNSSELLLNVKLMIIASVFQKRVFEILFRISSSKLKKRCASHNCKALPF